MCDKWFTVEGNHFMKGFCREKGLPLCELGKVIVAKDEFEVPGIIELERRALASSISFAHYVVNRLLLSN